METINGQKWRRILLGASGVLASVVAIGSVLIHPYGNVRAANFAQPLLAGAEVDASVLTIIQRSCQNCHSDKTEWPWYSHVAPISILIESDVAHGRSRMNLSHWSDYGNRDRQAILLALSAVARSGEMPPAKYTLLHPDAKLSTEDRKRLYGWARREQQRLKHAVPRSVGD